MSEYPILVERFTGRQSLTIACETCDAVRIIDADEICNDDFYECPADWRRRLLASTDRRCGGTACMKYAEGEPCGNCGKLDHEQPMRTVTGAIRAIDVGCCSRRCQLQGDYAASLKGQAA